MPVVGEGWGFVDSRFSDSQYAVFGFSEPRTLVFEILGIQIFDCRLLRFRIQRFPTIVS